MYVEVIGSHGNAISPLASLHSLLPLFPPRVASFPQAHLLPPLSLWSPRASRPPGTCKYMAEEKLKRWQILTEHVSTNLCRARDLGSIQKAASHASIATKKHQKAMDAMVDTRKKPSQSGLTLLHDQHPLAKEQEHYIRTRIKENKLAKNREAQQSIEKRCFVKAVYSTRCP